MGVDRVNGFSKVLNIKRYSDNTIVAYVSFLQLFQSVFKIIDFEKLKDRDILNYCYQYIAHKEFGYSSQKQILSAIKLFYKEIYGRYANLDSVRSKHKPKSNPVFLSKKEIKKLLNCLGNLKHKVMLTCVYSLWLRSDELISLKVTDLEGI
jgi:integrase/recombinase XerD